jgi:hypothetical protein
MPSVSKSTGVLMVGSFPGASSREVFTRVATALPGRLHTIPDGETGDRWNYIGWQLTRFRQEARRMELGGTALPTTGVPAYQLDDVKPTGYDEAAIASYNEFVDLRRQGVISSDMRFQVGLPTPYNVLIGHLKPEVIPAIEPLYEQRMVETLENLVAAIPHEDLVIQWDLCFEMTALEVERGQFEATRHQAYFPPPVLPKLVERIVRLAQHIPVAVPLAFHLCYGDLQHKHFVEPQDTSLLVEVANTLLEHEALGPRIEWLHLPVPKDRLDVDYFAPLNKLSLRRNDVDDTPRLYIGLVHANDLAGTQRRIDVARATVPFSFGVSTECGLGRTPSHEIASVLKICNDVTVKTMPENL